jgi:hypothetical protein
MLKNEALQFVSNDGFVINRLPIELQQDNDIIITALKNTLFSLKSIPIEHLNNDILAFIFDNNYQEYYEDILYIIDNSKNINILQNVDYNLKNNKKLIEILSVINTKSIKYASKEILNDKVFFLDIIKQYRGKYYNILKYLSDDLKDDEELIYELLSVKTYTFEFKYISDRLKNNYDFILKVIKKNSDILEYVSKEFKNNIEIVLETVNTNGYMLKYASKQLQNNKKVVLEAIKNYGLALKYAGKELKNDKDIVLHAVNRNGLALQYVNNELKNDKDIVSCAVNNNGVSLCYAGEEFKDDKDIVLCAVNNEGGALQYASERLQNDKEIVLHAVTNNNNSSLEYEELNNEDIISRAFINPYNFTYASNELRNDKIFVLNLLKININIINFASEKIHEEIILDIDFNDENIYILKMISSDILDNKEIMLTIIKKNHKILNYISNRLKNDQEFLCILIKYKPEILSEPFFKNKFSNTFIFEILKLDLFSYVPNNIQKKFENLEKIFNNKEININNLFDVFIKNIDNFIDNKNVMNKIFKEKLEDFIHIWYKSKSIRNMFLNYTENNEEFCILLSEEYNVVFENIKIFDETLDISNINDERFINIKNINEASMKKTIIYY